MMRKSAIALAVVPFLAACGGGSGGGAVQTAASKPAPIKTAVRTPQRPTLAPPRVQVIPGLEGLIGATGADLTRQLGAPRLDVIEGDARKLQFAGTACVLDVYLYPAAAGREPTATYVDARRASDGQEVDRAACVGALLRRPPAPAAAPAAPGKQG
ncbi:MAG: hypothetical protein ACKOQ3_14255 [Novosphingobium sp.]